MIDGKRADNRLDSDRSSRVRPGAAALRWSTSAASILFVVAALAITAGVGALASAVRTHSPAARGTAAVATPAVTPSAPAETSPSASKERRSRNGRRTVPEATVAPPPTVAERPAAVPAPAGEQLDRPPLQLVVWAAPSGQQLLGPRVAKPTGCGELVGEASPSGVRVDGVRYDPSADCPAPKVTSALAVPIETDRVHLAIHYGDRSGTYVADRTDSGVTLAFGGGIDVAPPRAASWWVLPADLLAVRTEAADAATASAVAGRIEGELLSAGSERFGRPDGEPIVADLARLERWREWASDDGRVSVRLYRSPLDEAGRRRAAENAVARTQCASLTLLRPGDADGGGLRVSSPCSRSA